MVLFVLVHEKSEPQLFKSKLSSFKCNLASCSLACLNLICKFFTSSNHFGIFPYVKHWVVQLREDIYFGLIATNLIQFHYHCLHLIDVLEIENMYHVSIKLHSNMSGSLGE